MTTTVHVSKTFTVNPNDQQVLEELRLLAARGFEVLGPLDLTPAKAVAVEPKTHPRNRASEIIHELHAGGLRLYETAALMGVTSSCVAVWKSTNARYWPKGASASRVKELEALLKRSRSLPEGSTALHDEAKGASAAQKRLRAAGRGKGKPLSDEQRLGMAVMKESGSKVTEISKAFGVNRRTVHRVLKDLEV